MEHIRCITANVTPGMLHDIVNKVVEKDDAIELIANVYNVDDLHHLIETQTIDVLIIGVDCQHARQIYDDLIKVHTDVLVMGLIDDGHDAMVFLNNIGIDEMLELIKLFTRK